MAVLKLCMFWSIVERRPGIKFTGRRPMCGTWTTHVLPPSPIDRTFDTLLPDTRRSPDDRLPPIAYRHLERQTIAVHRWDVCDPVAWLERWLIDPQAAID